MTLAEIIVTLEEKVINLECKLNEIIELLKFFIRIDNGLSRDATDLLLAHIEKMEADYALK